MKKFLTIASISASLITNPSFAGNIVVKQGVIFTETTNNSSITQTGGHWSTGDREYTFTSDYDCDDNTKYLSNGAHSVITNSACINQMIKSGSEKTLEIGADIDNLKIEIGAGSNPTTISQTGISVEGGNLLKKNTDGSIQLGSDGNDIDVMADGLNIDGAAVITKNSDGTIQIGTDENDIDITSEGLAIDGEPLITKKANGELHIGKNSWITIEENGRQKVYAKDANGNSIPIDYTNGTKLLINGRDVEQSINNVGALSAALTGLPTVPTDTTLACGLGTGTHGGDFAFSGGCASKVNENLSINYAASMTMPGQDYAGDFEDKFSARAGFVWKLGKSTKPIQISIKETNELKKEISELKKNNNQIISQNKALLARLERLEKVALSETQTKDLATIKLP